MSNTTNLYSSASEPGLSRVLTPSGCASPFTYHPAPVNEPVPSHPFPQSCCASPFVHPSTYSIDGEPGPCSRVACMSPYQSHVQAQNIFMNPYYSQFVPGTTPTPSYAPVHSPVKPFTLKHLNGHIKVCAGCRNGFRNPSGSLPGAPYDICICHEESREIIQPKTKQPATVWNKVHYHCHPACVQMNNPQFVPSLLLIPDDIQPKL